MAVPKWITGDLPPGISGALMRGFWREPWTLPVDRDDETPRDRAARVFLRRCWRHGLVTPHFTRQEAASHDGRPVPNDLRRPCQTQGIRLEQLRHELGKPVRILSWYRSPEHNQSVGGASQSQHLFARACDFPDTLPYDICRRIWRNGGIGTYQGRVRHADARGSYAEWSYG
jgi:hypothetical protein